MVGQALRFSRNDRTVSVIKLFIIWHQQQLLPFALFLQAHLPLWALRENNALQFSHN